MVTLFSLDCLQNCGSHRRVMGRIVPWFINTNINIISQTTTTTTTLTTTLTATYLLGRRRGLKKRKKGRSQHVRVCVRACLHLFYASSSLCCCELMPMNCCAPSLSYLLFSYGETSYHARGRRAHTASAFWSIEPAKQRQRAETGATGNRRRRRRKKKSKPTALKNSKRRLCQDHVLHTSAPTLHTCTHTHALIKHVHPFYSMPSTPIFHSNPFFAFALI